MGFPFALELTCYLFDLEEFTSPCQVVINDLLSVLPVEVVQEVIHDLTYPVIFDRFVYIDNTLLETLDSIREVEALRFYILKLLECFSCELGQQTNSSFLWHNSCCGCPKVNLTKVRCPVTGLAVPFWDVAVTVLWSTLVVVVP